VTSRREASGRRSPVEKDIRKAKPDERGRVRGAALKFQGGVRARRLRRDPKSEGLGASVSAKNEPEKQVSMLFKKKYSNIGQGGTGVKEPNHYVDPPRTKNMAGRARVGFSVNGTEDAGVEGRGVIRRRKISTLGGLANQKQSGQTLERRYSLSDPHR